METTSIDKMTRLSNEFQSALQMANSAIEREEVKRSLCLEDHGIWNLRSRMISITSKFPDLRNPDDDKWLVDKEKIKKSRPTIDLQLVPRIPRPAAATPQVFDEMLDLGPAVVHPRARYDDIQYKIEQDLRKKQEQDVLGWVDATNVRSHNPRNTITSDMFPDSLSEFYPTLSTILSRTQRLRIIIIERAEYAERTSPFVSPPGRQRWETIC
jgi:hypothetical protein